MASKSTPLSQLNSERNNPNDSKLVNEILAEIGNEQKSNEPSQEEIMKQKMYQEQMLQQQMLEQQQYEQHMYEQQMRQQQEMQQQQQQNQMTEPEPEQKVLEKEHSSKALKIAGVSIEGKLKSSLIVALICLALGVPAVNKMISGLLPNKEFIMNNTNTVVAVIKGLIAGGAFYLSSDC